jgi:hypothetical protein
MKADTTRSGEDRKIRQLQDNQKKLVAALQMLFDLVEEYAPRWYTQQHRDKAMAALARIETRRP